MANLQLLENNQFKSYVIKYTYSELIFGVLSGTVCGTATFASLLMFVWFLPKSVAEILFCPSLKKWKKKSVQVLTSHYILIVASLD